MMRVTKRSGDFEEVSFDKVLNRIKNLSNGLDVNFYDVAQKVCSRIYDGVSTSQLDELAATICSSLIVLHPDYNTLAARIAISNHHKNTSPSFSETVSMLYNAGVLNDEFYSIVMKNKEKLNSSIKYDRDYDLDYFGFKTLERSYLLKVDDKPIERPQHLFMRVAVAIHQGDIKDTLETYDLMSQKYMIHASPVLFNAGTKMQQLASCFLIQMESDSIQGIYNTLKDVAEISKSGGGIGLNIHNIRSAGSKIRNSGVSSGIVPMLRVFNETGCYVNQEGKRNGSIAVYLEMWHADISEFLDMKRPHSGPENMKARDLFYSVWMCDLFMERVKNNEKWSLMNPQVSSGLDEVYGDEFVELYTKYENEGKYVRQVNARDLWNKILESEIESGVPYISYKDSANKKSNQKNLGTIKSSNLCNEILEYSSSDEIAVCNLASINLSNLVEYDEQQNPFFNFDKLHHISRTLTKNLNKAIDITYYPVEKCRRSNLRHRPIAIGVSGLADTYIAMRYPFDSDNARKLNKLIFETLYHGTIQQSMLISKTRSELILKHKENDREFPYNLNINEYENIDEMIAKGYAGSYSTFYNSPAQQGQLQFDLWNVEVSNERYNWTELKEDIKKYGLRNSLNVALMPTCSTSNILGVSECFEPLTSLVYKRKTLGGEFVLVNKSFVKDLMKLGLWNDTIRQKLIINDGTTQNIDEIPEDIKNLYKTSFELSQKVLIDQSADRAPFVCQTQSMNLFVENPDNNKLSSMHFYAWSKGLKTGIYYLRSKTKATAQKFTVDVELQKFANVKKSDDESKKSKRVFKCDQLDENGACMMCSS